MVDRMIRAALLLPGLYEEVEHDSEATGQALLVVVIASIAAGIGALGGGLGGFVWGIVGNILAWAAFALICYIVGTTFLAGPRTEATWGQLLRTVGFAASPAALLIFGFIPVFGGLITLAVFVWLLTAVVVAIRAALDFDIGSAVATAIIGWVIWLVVSLVIRSVFGGVF